MKLTTPVNDQLSSFAIQPHHHIMALGSCFANVVGQRLCDYRLRTMLNPTGTIYNPQSIFHLLKSAVDIAENRTTAEEVTEKHLFKAQDGKWYSWMAASLISGESREKCSSLMQETLQKMATFINHMDVLILTFGTDHYYALTNEKCSVVANCHKMPASMFCEQTMSIDDITKQFNQLYSRLIALRPELRIILTVSPYRYLKYGLHQSQLSKSRLLLATEACQQINSETYYFPAYEILNDELRDYRFYAPDMVHPSPVAEEIIWQRFCDSFTSPELQNWMRDWSPVLKSINHRATDNTDSTFAQVQNARIEQLKTKYPEMF